MPSHGAEVYKSVMTVHKAPSTHKCDTIAHLHSGAQRIHQRYAYCSQVACRVVDETCKASEQNCSDHPSCRRRTDTRGLATDWYGQLQQKTLPCAAAEQRTSSQVVYRLLVQPFAGLLGHSAPEPMDSKSSNDLAASMCATTRSGAIYACDHNTYHCKNINLCV